MRGNDHGLLGAVVLAAACAVAVPEDEVLPTTAGPGGGESDDENGSVDGTGEGGPETGSGSEGDDAPPGDGDGDGDGEGDSAGSEDPGTLFDVLGFQDDVAPDVQICDATDPAFPATDCADVGIVLEAPYAESYTCHVLGPVPGLPLEWGAINLPPGENNRLLVGGDSNEAGGMFYSVGVARDAGCHILGFDGSPTTLWGDGQYNDGGMVYHPDSDVMLYARWPVNELGQIEPGHTHNDRVDSLGQWVVYSFAALGFIPPGLPGEGELRFVAWPDGSWYRVELDADGNGTYDILEIEQILKLPGGPEGFIYVGDWNPEFEQHSLIVSDWSQGGISTYEVDASGDPILASRKPFITGLSGPEGAFIDPLSGDFLFATWGGSDVMVSIRGFDPDPPG